MMTLKVLRWPEHCGKERVPDGEIAARGSQVDRTAKVRIAGELIGGACRRHADARACFAGHCDDWPEGREIDGVVARG